MSEKFDETYSETEIEQMVAEAEAALESGNLVAVDSKTMKPVDLRGRPSLNGSGHSPKLQVRVDDELSDALKARAEKEGRSVSDLVRELLRAAV